MLPDLLFSDNSMQDISREEFGLLNGGCDKDAANQQDPSSDSPLERIKLDRTPDFEPVSIKLEESSDIFPWHFNATDIGSNLLRHSDDPLISGAIDDNQNELSPIENCTESSTSSTTKSTLLSPNTVAAIRQRQKKAPRVRRKGQFKLRFHHQALPAEYLDHYEAQQKSLLQKIDTTSTIAESKSPTITKTTSQTKYIAKITQASTTSAETVNTISVRRLKIEAPSLSAITETLPIAKGTAVSESSMLSVTEQKLQQERANESIRNWLQKIAEYQGETITIPVSSPNLSIKDDFMEMDSAAFSVNPLKKIVTTNASTALAITTTTCSRVVSYKDLPYMGEMTLENSKPRRGRKPKKADICHLIYKNYGTILPGTPKDLMKGNASELNIGHRATTTTNMSRISTTDTNKSEIQSIIISSLLEKRLTQESKRNIASKLKIPKEKLSANSSTPTNTIVGAKMEIDEPLNLCVRDRSTYETLSVSSDSDESDAIIVNESNRSTPTITPSDITTDKFLAANLKMSLPNFQSALRDTSQTPTDSSIKDAWSSPTLSRASKIGDNKCVTINTPLKLNYTTTDLTSTPTTNYVYWPGAGVFIHPMALYYQKMVDAGTPILIPSATTSTTNSNTTTVTNTLRSTTPSVIVQQSKLLSHNPSITPSTPSTSSSPISITQAAFLLQSTSSSSPSSTTAYTPLINKDSYNAKILIPKNISQLLKQEHLNLQSPLLINKDNIRQSTRTPASSIASSSPSPSSPSNTTITSLSSKGQTPFACTAPQKRKRSAIFIPPMPAETSSNHATEVSICKFKFTGGAKPSLQEKKMLSVDSGGNFRYYSGTGDKSMRGYEFFPRESLQQSSLISGSSAAGAFLNTPGEKMHMDLSPPSLGISNELLQIPELPSPPINTVHNPILAMATTTLPCLIPTLTSENSSLNDRLLFDTNQNDNKCNSMASIGPFNTSALVNGSPSNDRHKHQLDYKVIKDQRPQQEQQLVKQQEQQDKDHLRNNGASQSSSDILKRKSRRSLQREKLEKTFKEKGFLIQTQQLESAEGATYCKFRQLRKFTRYLFRSWKDYLPGDLQQGNSAVAAAAAAVSAETATNCGFIIHSPTGTGVVDLPASTSVIHTNSSSNLTSISNGSISGISSSRSSTNSSTLIEPKSTILEQ